MIDVTAPTPSPLTEWSAILDALLEPVVVADARGRVVYRNRTWLELAERCGASAPLERATNEAIRALLDARAGGADAQRQAIEAASVSVETCNAKCQLRPSYVGPAVLGEEWGVLVAVDVPWRLLPSAASLAQRFDLTAREVEIVRLLILGETTKSIAQDLAVSQHTARTHVERVLRKMGVTTRAAVAARVAGLI